MEISEISGLERQVWNALSALKRIPKGPDVIPYWIWKEDDEILLFLGHRSLIKNKTQTAVINILNLSQLSTSTSEVKS